MTINEWKDTCGDNLASLLRERRMTQTELAAESGLSPSVINEYVRKRHVPSLQAVINMSYALDVTVDDLIDFEEPIDF